MHFSVRVAFRVYEENSISKLYSINHLLQGVTHTWAVYIHRTLSWNCTSYTSSRLNLVKFLPGWKKVYLVKVFLNKVKKNRVLLITTEFGSFNISRWCSKIDPYIYHMEPRNDPVLRSEEWIRSKKAGPNAFLRMQD